MWVGRDRWQHTKLLPVGTQIRLNKRVTVFTCSPVYLRHDCIMCCYCYTCTAQYSIYTFSPWVHKMCYHVVRVTMSNTLTTRLRAYFRARTQWPRWVLAMHTCSAWCPEIRSLEVECYVGCRTRTHYHRHHQKNKKHTFLPNSECFFSVGGGVPLFSGGGVTVLNDYSDALQNWNFTTAFWKFLLQAEIWGHFCGEKIRENSSFLGGRLKK